MTGKEWNKPAAAPTWKKEMEDFIFTIWDVAIWGANSLAGLLYRS